MQSMVILEVHMNHENVITHPQLLLFRLVNTLAGSTIHLPGPMGLDQQVELWNVVTLTGLEQL